MKPVVAFADPSLLQERAATLQQRLAALRGSMHAATAADQTALGLRDLLAMAEEIARHGWTIRQLSQPDHRRRDELQSLTEELLLLVRRCSAQSVEDILVKLAIWRALSPECDQPVSQMEPATAYLYCVFEDVADLTGNHSVFNAYDLTRRLRHEAR